MSSNYGPPADGQEMISLIRTFGERGVTASTGPKSTAHAGMSKWVGSPAEPASDSPATLKLQH
jgi:hypothetical protein